MLTRRHFLQTTALAAAAPANQPKRIAIVAATYPRLADRFLVGYPYAGAWHKPDMRVVSLYTGQKMEGDRAREFGFQVYPTVSEALRCGGKALAVDAVICSGFLAECIQVFEQDGHAVPVFQDAQLSPSFEKAKAMLEASRRLRFPLLAGSSLPVTWRLPAIDLPAGCKIEEALMVGEGDAMDFHALEALQCMVERRHGGETGVKAVQLLEGDAVWRAEDDGRYSKALLTSALSRSDTPLGLTVKDGRTQDLVASGELRKLARKPAAYFLEYRDGLRATLLMLDGAIQDFNFAARLGGVPQIQSTQFLMTPEPNATYTACLAHKIEEMIESGTAPYPADRTLLAGGILESCQASKLKDYGRLETPHLNVAYAAPQRSQFAQG